MQYAVGHRTDDRVVGYNGGRRAELTVHLEAAWVILGICWVEDDSYGTVTEVWLEITGPVATDARTWGGVKALYR